MHMIDFTGGRARMAYTGEEPWHGFGQNLPPGRKVEDWIEAAGLGFEYRLQSLRRESPAGFWLRGVPTHKAVVRDDTGDALGVVGANFKLVQPREVLEFFRDLTEAGGFELETAGALKGGAVVWALARSDTLEPTWVMGQDELLCRLLLTTAADGTMNTTAKFVATRTVCWNTLSIGLAESGDEVKVPHRSRFDAADVKRRLGVGASAWAGFEEQADKLARFEVAPAGEQRWLVETFGDPAKPLDEQPGLRTMKKVHALFEGQGQGAGLRSAKGTAWGLVNAATEYVDHHKPERASGNRLHSAWNGGGAALKRKAWDNAARLAA